MCAQQWRPVDNKKRFDRARIDFNVGWRSAVAQTVAGVQMREVLSMHLNDKTIEDAK
jgi:hypothetical protein